MKTVTESQGGLGDIIKSVVTHTVLAERQQIAHLIGDMALSLDVTAPPPDDTMNQEEIDASKAAIRAFAAALIDLLREKPLPDLRVIEVGSADAYAQELTKAAKPTRDC